MSEKNSVLIGATTTGKEARITIDEPPRFAILGGSGSGKTVLLWNICLVLAKELKSKVQFLAEDVKLTSCEPLKSRLCADIITEPIEVLPMFQKVQQLLLDRQRYMQEHNLDKIDPYSELAEQFPMVIVICEELVSLMNNPELPSTVNKALRDWFLTYTTRCRSANMGIICSSQSYVESLTIPTAARAQLTTRFIMRCTQNDAKLLLEGQDEMAPAHLLSDRGSFYFCNDGDYNVWTKAKTWNTTAADATRVATENAIHRRDIGLGWTVESPF